MKQEGSKKTAADDDRRQVKQLKEVNKLLYNFPEESWSNSQATISYANQLNQSLQKLDLSKHKRLPAGSFTKGKDDAGKLKAIVYEDVYEVVLRLFTISYLGSRGCGADGDKDTSITAELKDMHKAMMAEFF